MAKVLLQVPSKKALTRPNSTAYLKIPQALILSSLALLLFTWRAGGLAKPLPSAVNPTAGFFRL
jgi:hypothetical protein